MVRWALMAALLGLLGAGCGGGDGVSVGAVARDASLGAQGGVASTAPAATQDASISAPTAVAQSDLGQPQVTPTPTPEPVPPPADASTSPVDTKSLPADLRAITAAALADAAQRTGSAAGDMVVVGAEAVVWADGSLGCPEPGVLYTMALVPGYRVRIAVAGNVMDYHASQRGNLVYCPAGRAVDPLASGAS